MESGWHVARSIWIVLDSPRRRLAPMMLWLVRAAWALLPVTAGPAAAGALDDWSSPPRAVAEAFLWAAWAITLIALLAPRPIGLTVVRVVAPSFVALAAVVLVTGAADRTDGGLALAATLLAAGLALVIPAVSFASANGAAYGDERRYPLRIPPVLWLGLLPVTPLLVAAGIAAGPLLLADGRIIAGIGALVAGLAVAAFAARSLHGLSRRWAVLVPAGLVLADPLTLPDSVLFLRERVHALRAMERGEPVPAGVLDLRLGATTDSMALMLDRPTEFLQARRGRRSSVPVQTIDIRFAPLEARDLLATAGARRFRVNV
jgi:hypothetical protein